MPSETPGRRLLGYATAVAVPALAIPILLLLPAITARAAVPIFLLAVLVIARTWGLGPALAACLSASIGYSYAFLPMASLDPDALWLGFVTFTTSALIVAWLAARGEQRRREALAGRREIERLYQELQTAFDRASEAEAARRNEQLKAALLDALTHNLRTPLTAIKAAVTALMGHGDRSGSTGLSKEGRRDLLQVIDEESDRLNRFIEGLSAADRPDPLQPMRYRGAPVEEVVQAAVARAQALTRHHIVRVDVPPGAAAVAVDPAAIVEVLYILIDNATQYAPANTEIRVTVSQHDPLHLAIEVADEGPGIAPALRERVFEKFFRIPGRASRDPNRAGAGLGLPIARRLVEAQAGRIWIQGAPAQGTAVIMTLPSAARSGAADPLDAASAASSQELM